MRSGNSCFGPGVTIAGCDPRCGPCGDNPGCGGIKLVGENLYRSVGKLDVEIGNDVGYGLLNPALGDNGYILGVCLNKKKIDRYLEKLFLSNNYHDAATCDISGLSMG